MPTPLVPPGPSSPTAPALRARGVTPNDVTVVGPTRAVWVAAGGDLEVLMAGDTVSVLIGGVPDGTLLPLSVAKILTGTTASGIVALF
jgi:hypothetical protein